MRVEPSGFDEDNNNNNNNSNKIHQHTQNLKSPWSFLPTSSVLFLFICYQELPRHETTSRCPSWAAMKWGVIQSSVVPWSFIETRLNQKSDNFKVTIPLCSIRSHIKIICGTRLNQKSDNVKVPLLSCYVKWRFVIICQIRRGSVFEGTGLNQKSDNFKVPLMSCYE